MAERGSAELQVHNSVILTLSVAKGKDLHEHHIGKFYGVALANMVLMEILRCARDDKVENLIVRRLASVPLLLSPSRSRGSSSIRFRNEN